MATKSTKKKAPAKGKTARKTAVKKQALPAAAPKAGTVAAKAVKKAPVKRKQKAKAPPGRPSVYSDEVALRVLERIMEGDCLEEACLPDDLPCKRTWLRWVAANERLQRRYVGACQVRALMRAEECVQIADDADDKSKSGVLKARLRVSTRQWEIQRLANKVYGKDGVVLPPADDPGASMDDPEVSVRLKALRKEVVK